MKRLVGSLTASWRNFASNLRHCTRSFIVTSWEMHFPRHIRPVLTTKSLRFGAYILRASLTAIPFSLPRQLRFPSDVARSFVGTVGYEQSRRERKKIEMRFAHLKRILRLDRLRLRGPRGAQDEFVLAAIAQNLRRLAKLVARPPPYAVQCIA